MQLIDTHCHIHFDDFIDNIEEVIASAGSAGIDKMISVGCSLDDSERAVIFASGHDNVWASVGAHPHDGDDFLDKPDSKARLLDLARHEKVVAIGEIGLDFFKNYVPEERQLETLKIQLDATHALGLPYIFHVREAFDAFWKLIDNYPGVRGVVHSFSADEKHLKEVLDRGLYVGLNGIMTFTKLDAQLRAAKQVPLNRLLLETDAPFLAPKPFRGQTCEPKHVAATAEFLAALRNETPVELATATTANAEELFGI